MSTINNSNIGLVPGSAVRSISPITIGQQSLTRPTGISQPYTPINNLNPGLSLPQGSRIVGNPIPAQLMQARNVNLARPTSQYNIGTPTRVGAPNFQPIRSSQINSIQPPMQRRFVQNVTIPQPQISPVRNYIQAAPAPMPIPPQMVRQIPFSPPPQPIVQQFARPNPIPMQPIFTPPPPPPTQSYVQQVPQTVQTHYAQQTIEDQPVEVRKSRWQNHYEEEQPAPPPPVAASAPPTKSKCHPAIFGILGLLALAGLITGIIFALKGRNNNSQPVTQAPGIPGTNILPQAQGGTVTVETTIIDKSQNSTTQTNPTVSPSPVPAPAPSITPNPTPTSATVVPVPPITIPVTNIQTKDPIRKDPILDTIFIPGVGTQQVQYKNQPGTVGTVQPDRIQSQPIGSNGFTFPTSQGAFEPTVPTATQGSTTTIAPSTTNPQSGVANMDPNSFTSQFSRDAQSVKPTVVSTDPSRLPSHRVRRYID